MWDRRVVKKIQGRSQVSNIGGAKLRKKTLGGPKLRK